MAIESNSAVLEQVEAAADQGNITWDRSYRKARTDYTLSVEKDARQVTFHFAVPEGADLTVNGAACEGSYLCTVQDGQAEVRVTVTKNGKQRNYRFVVEGDQTSADLADLAVSSSNTWADVDSRLALSPAFDPERKEYTADRYDGKNAWLNIFAVRKDSSAVIKAEAVRGVKRIQSFGKTAGSGNADRFAVYFEEQEAEAAVKLTVTTRTGKVSVVQVTLQRLDSYPPVLTDGIVTRLDDDRVKAGFQSNETGHFYCTVTQPGEKPVFDTTQTGTLMTLGENSLELDIPRDDSRMIWILAEDIAGNRMTEPLKLPVYAYREIPVTIETRPSGGSIHVQDAAGRTVEEQKGRYVFLNGNVYTITAKMDGYETREMTVQADEQTTSYILELKSMMSANADLKQLFVSSSDQYGKGILKLSPEFEKQENRYSAAYPALRQSLYLWTEAADSRSRVKVYAIAGIRGSSVQQDETLAEQRSADGHSFWKVEFAQEEREARVRIRVTAEDGTTRDYYVTLRLTDDEPPVLKKVSASRISEEKASVVYKTSEKGYRYDIVVEAGAAIPEISVDGRGTEVQAGTDSILVTGLSKGEKDLIVVVKDASGNVSDPLVIRIPDLKNGMQIIHRPGSGGHKSYASMPGGKNDGLGSKSNLQKRKGIGSGTGRKSDIRTGKTAEAPVRSEKDNLPSGDRRKMSEEKKHTETGKTPEETGAGEERPAQAGGRDTVLRAVGRNWGHLTVLQKTLLLLLLPGILWLAFWKRARRYSKEKA